MEMHATMESEADAATAAAALDESKSDWRQGLRAKVQSLPKGRVPKTTKGMDARPVPADEAGGSGGGGVDADAGADESFEASGEAVEGSTGLDASSEDSSSIACSGRRGKKKRTLLRPLNEPPAGPKGPDGTRGFAAGA